MAELCWDFIEGAKSLSSKFSTVATSDDENGMFVPRLVKSAIHVKQSESFFVVVGHRVARLLGLSMTDLPKRLHHLYFFAFVAFALQGICFVGQQVFYPVEPFCQTGDLFNAVLPLFGGFHWMFRSPPNSHEIATPQMSVGRSNSIPNS